MCWNIYLRREVVYVPTVAVTEAGFFMDIDPVGVVEVGDRLRVGEEIRKTIAKGNPIVETPTRASFPKPIILNYVNVKSWAAFLKGASYWKILEEDASYRLVFQSRLQSGGWEDDFKKTETFDGVKAIDELVDVIFDQMQNAVKE